jgi:hypothetical protein
MTGAKEIAHLSKREALPTLELGRTERNPGELLDYYLRMFARKDTHVEESGLAALTRHLKPHPCHTATG